LVFAVTFRVFPADGYVGITSSPGQWLTHLVLPVVALSLGSIGQVAFQARAATLDVLGREFIRTLQAAGISRRRILAKHVARNAAIPVMTTAGILFLFLLGGVVVIETVFNLPGMGNLMLQSVEGHDLAVVQGVVLYFTVVVVLVNLGIDLLNAWLDPRSRAR
jgi:peptide/nickel transport system permease protein